MDGFFSFLGKFALVLLVVAILAGGGYYLGTGKLPFPQNPTPAAVTTSAPEQTPELITGVPTPTIAMQQVTVSGLSGTSFGGFILNVPATWTVTKEENPGISQKITVSRGAYAVSIYRAATGGGGCLYPGDPLVEMSSTFGPFVTLHDASGNEFRRAIPTGSTSGFTVCQKGDSSFGLPTMYGHITYGTPGSPDAATLQEMDAIFATLKKS